MIIKTKPIFAMNNPPDSNSLGSVPYVFFMSESPISNAIYCEYLNQNRNHARYLLTKIPEGIIKSNHKFMPQTKLLGHYPVTDINWLAAEHFVQWLNLIDKEKSYYLPSLDEWYKAAYFDPISKKYYNYPNRTDNIDTLSNNIADHNSINVENIIGNKTKNKYFAYNYSFFDVRDMAGNVYEMIKTADRQCTIVGSAWNRNRLNAHKYNCGSRSISRKYSNEYIGFRLCRKCSFKQLYISLHNEFNESWQNDSLSVYDTNNGVLCKNITLIQNHNPSLTPLNLYDYTDKIMIIEYHSSTNLFQNNSIKLYNNNQQIIYEYTFKKYNDKILVNLAGLI